MNLSDDAHGQLTEFLASTLVRSDTPPLSREVQSQRKSHRDFRWLLGIKNLPVASRMPPRWTSPTSLRQRLRRGHFKPHQINLKISSVLCRDHWSGELQDADVPLLARLVLKEKNMNTNKSSTPAPATPMTPKAAGRIQGAEARSNGGNVAKGSFAARAQRTAAKGGKR